MAMTLEEALRQGKVKIGDYIDYKPISGRCVLTQEQTGREEGNVFETEDFGWRLDNIDRSLVLIATSTTKPLHFKGKNGYENGIGAMKTLCESCYFNPQFSQKVVPITDELQQKISGCHYIPGDYWLGSTGCYKDVGYCGYGIYYYAVGCQAPIIRILYDWKGDYEDCDYFGVRPVAYLRPDILLGEGLGTERDLWKILPPQD